MISTYYTLSTQWYPYFKNANNYSIKSLKSISIHRMKLIDMFEVHKYWTGWEDLEKNA